MAMDIHGGISCIEREYTVQAWFWFSSYRELRVLELIPKDPEGTGKLFRVDPFIPLGGPVLWELESQKPMTASFGTKPGVDQGSRCC